MRIFHNERPEPGQMRRFLAALACLWTASAASGGDTAEASPPLPSGAPRAQDELGAQAILRRAAMAQGRDLGAAPQRLSFHARMAVRVLTDRGDDVQLRVETKFLGAEGDEPDRIWRSVTEDDSPTITAFDGEVPWSRSGSGPVTELLGEAFDEDRARLRQDIELTRNLAQLFLLDELARKIKDLERLPDKSAAGKHSYVLGGRALQHVNGALEEVRLRLFIEHGTHHVLGCEIDYADPERDTLTFCIWEWKKSRSGGLIPTEIKIHYDNATRPSQIITPGVLDFSVKLHPKAFSPK